MPLVHLNEKWAHIICDGSYRPHCSTTAGVVLHPSNSIIYAARENHWADSNYAELLGITQGLLKFYRNIVNSYDYSSGLTAPKSWSKKIEQVFVWSDSQYAHYVFKNQNYLLKRYERVIWELRRTQKRYALLNIDLHPIWVEGLQNNEWHQLCHLLANKVATAWPELKTHDYFEGSFEEVKTRAKGYLQDLKGAACYKSNLNPTVMKG